MAEVMRFKIGSKVYTTAALDEISLRDLMLFDTQAADMGLNVSWADVERVSVEMAAAQEAADAAQTEPAAHPRALLMIGVTIWASRRGAGEDVTLEQAVDFPLSKLEWLEAPKDHKAPTSKKSPSARSPRRIASVSDARSSETTPATSERQSESA